MSDSTEFDFFSSESSQESINSQEQNVNENELSAALDEKSQEESEQDIKEEETKEEQEQPKEVDKFAAKFAALSRREKELREREQLTERKQAEIEARLKEIEERSKPVEPKEPSVEELLRKQPLKALEKLGWSYEDITRMQLEDNMPIDIQLKLKEQELEEKFQQKINALEEKLQQKVQSDEDEKYNLVINNFKTNLEDFIETNEQYELIKANNASDMVFEVIEDYYNKTGRVLDKKEAADQVEEFLEEEIRKVLKASKKFNTSSETPTKPNPVKTLSPTLSNTQSATSVQERAESLLSDDESKRKASAIIRWDS